MIAPMTDEKRPRPWGTGSVYQHRDGQWRARLPGRHGRKNLDGSYATKGDAEAALAAALEMLAAAPIDAPTLASFGETWMPARDVRKNVLARDRLRWSAYVEGAPIARMPLVEVSELDVRAWLGKLRGTRRPVLSAQTKQNALSLLRSAFEAARAPGGPLYGRPNPAAEVTLGKRERARTTERWTWLRAPQVETVRTAPIPERPRLIYTIAIFTGLRAGELWGLVRQDLDFDRGVIQVRHSRDEATKGGQPREVPMLAPAADAFRRWLELLDASGARSHLGLVFPAPHGGHHAEGYDAGWSEIADELGLGHATFHDLRHTCASHLLMGTWAPRWIGRALRLEEIAAWLGHRDPKTTRRYAHLAPESIAALVQRDTTRDTIKSRSPDLNRGPTVYESVVERADRAEIEADPADVSHVVSRLRAAMVVAAEAIASGDPHRDHRALDLIDAAQATIAALTQAAPRARCAGAD